jgi:hypothetical protein
MCATGLAGHLLRPGHRAGATVRTPPTARIRPASHLQATRALHSPYLSTSEAKHRYESYDEACIWPCVCLCVCRSTLPTTSGASSTSRSAPRTRCSRCACMYAGIFTCMHVCMYICHCAYHHRDSPHLHCHPPPLPFHTAGPPQGHLLHQQQPRGQVQGRRGHLGARHCGGRYQDRLDGTYH